MPRPHYTAPGTSASRHLGAPSHVTPTGWRLVGKASSLLDEVPALTVGSPEDCVFAARFTVRSWISTDSAVARTLEVMSAALARETRGAPALSAAVAVQVPASRHGGIMWNTQASGDTWHGELMWRHPHVVNRARTCTTHVVLHQVTGILTLYVRVYAEPGQANTMPLAEVGQARPGFLSDLARACRLRAAWGETAPRTITVGDVDDFAQSTLIGDRGWPVLLLSKSDAEEYLISPDLVADEFLGLAQVFALDSQAASYRLTDALGDRRLSCFFGAMRLYLPRFSCADNPYDHPLLLGESVVDPMERAEMAGELALALRDEVPLPPNLHPRTETPAEDRSPVSAPRNVAEAPVRAYRAASDTSDRASTTPVLSSANTLAAAPPRSELGAEREPAATGAVSEALQQISATLSSLSDAIVALARSNQALTDEVARLRTTNAVRHGGMASLERRLERIDAHIRRQSGTSETSASSETPETGSPEQQGSDADTLESLSLVSVLRQAAERHADALSILDSAEHAAADSPYEDIERVAAVLDAMAEVARRRQRGTLGLPIRQAFREYGIDYRSGIADSTSDRDREQYQHRDSRGRLVECREHLALGGGTYDPRYVLRIYFTSREPLDPRFVIGHVGRHHRVQTTT